MKDRYIRVTAPAGFDGQATRRDYYFKIRNAAREFRLRIKRWKAEQKCPSDTLSFDDSDKRWLAYLRAHVGNLELLPAIVTHWERTAKPITRPLKVEELCRAFVLYREGKGLDKATLSEDRYISRRLQKHLGGYMAHELGVAEIRSFLDTAKTSDSLEHKLYKVGSLIFAYGGWKEFKTQVPEWMGFQLGNWQEEALALNATERKVRQERFRLAPAGPASPHDSYQKNYIRGLTTSAS